MVARNGENLCTHTYWKIINQVIQFKFKIVYYIFCKNITISDYTINLKDKGIMIKH